MKIAISIYIVGVIITLLSIIYDFKKSKERLQGIHLIAGLFSWFFLIFVYLDYLSNILIYDFGKTSKGKNTQKK